LQSLWRQMVESLLEDRSPIALPQKTHKASPSRRRSRLANCRMFLEWELCLCRISHRRLFPRRWWFGVGRLGGSGGGRRRSPGSEARIAWTLCLFMAYRNRGLVWELSDGWSPPLLARSMHLKVDKRGQLISREVHISGPFQDLALYIYIYMISHRIPN
jgi:hypothetical protein